MPRPGKTTSVNDEVTESKNPTDTRPENMRKAKLE